MESSPIAIANSARVAGRHESTLDGIRGLAILIVMFHHFEFLLPRGNGLVNAMKGLFYAGWSGVDLFFVLSGFLITGILVDTRDSGNYFSSFYARRILRIFPLYYSVLTGIVALAAVFYQPWFDGVMPLRKNQIYYFFYLNNWWILLKETWRWNIIGHFWSLAVEEQFYLLWPMCVWLTPRRRLPFLALGGCAAALVLRATLVLAYGPTHAIGQNTFTRMDALLMGACCALLVRTDGMMDKVRPWLPWVLALAGAGVFSIDVFAGELRKDGPYMQTLGFSLLAVGYSALLLQVYLRRGNARSLLQRVFGSRPLRQMGKYSYGIYVFHVPLLGIAYGVCQASLGLGTKPLNSLLFFLGLILSSFLIAAFSYEYFEQHFLRLKNRFTPRPALQRPSSAALQAETVLS